MHYIISHNQETKTKKHKKPSKNFFFFLCATHVSYSPLTPYKLPIPIPEQTIERKERKRRNMKKTTQKKDIHTSNQQRSNTTKSCDPSIHAVFNLVIQPKKKKKKKS
jgi:hypothetical protein